MLHPQYISTLMFLGYVILVSYFHAGALFWGQLKQSTISNLVAYWFENPQEIVE